MSGVADEAGAETLDLSGQAPDVVLVHWPVDEARRAAARRDGRPCLLLMPPGTTPPALGPLEDWTCEPVDPEELQRLLLRLRRRSRRTGPTIDVEGIVRTDEGWVVLAITEIAIASLLVESFEGLVGRDALVDAGWPDGGWSYGALNTRISRLRHRLEPLGLTIKTARNRGFIMTWRA